MTTEGATHRAVDHLVRFYEDDEHLGRVVGGPLADALTHEKLVVIVAHEAHRRLFSSVFSASGIDVAAREACGELVMLDAMTTMDRFIADDRIVQSRFDESVGDLVRRLCSNGRPVVIYGEMVALLWDAGQIPLVIDLEECWNALAGETPFTLYCGYRRSSLGDETHGPDLAKICELHSSVSGLDPGVNRPSPRRIGEISREFVSDALAPSAARLFALSALEQLDRGDAADVIALIVSELATNAVLHAVSDFTVAVSVASGGVRVEVSDHSVALPERHNPAPIDTHGRGMRIVENLADRWGVEVDHAGKVVWAEIA